MSGSYSGQEVPLGVAADAFYEKATDIRYLLDIVADIQRNHRIAPNHATSAPIWITGEVQDQAGEALVLLSCTECLRTFPETLGTAPNIIHKSLCPFCRVPVEYAIVQQSSMEATANFGSSSVGADIRKVRTTCGSENISKSELFSSVIAEQL